MENIEPFERWSDEQVLSAAVRYGEEARKWKNKFLGLLPEVDRRKLYVQKGFTSVMHFAQVVGGVSEAQVQTALRLNMQFRETPILHTLFTSGEIGMNKLARVASIANQDNEEFLANQVQMLSQASLETLVRDTKRSDTKILRTQNQALSAIEETAQVAVPLNMEVAQELLKLRDKGIDIDAELKLFLEQRKAEIEVQKEQIGENCQETDSRYVPKEVRDVLKKEYGTRCSMPGCTRPSEELHHTQRFSLAKKHDPRYMALLCREHHQIAHSRDVKIQEIKKRKRT